MCLIYSKEKTDKYKKVHRNQQRVVVWKLLSHQSKEDNTLVTPYQGVVVELGGVLEADKPYGEVPSQNEMTEIIKLGLHSWISSGAIHVYTTRVAARGEQCSCDKLIRCTALMRDFIAVDENGYEACFKKIKLGYNERK